MSDAVPRFKHDCDSCRFIRRGTYCEDTVSPAVPYDFYVCGPTKDPSLIARWSDKGSDYSSCSFWVQYDLDPTKESEGLLPQLYLEYIETPEGKRSLKYRALASLFWILGDYPFYDMEEYRAKLDAETSDAYAHILYLSEIGHDFSKLPKVLTPRMAKQAQRVLEILLS